MTCANCYEPAVWSHRVAGAEPVFFCNRCLPESFRLSAITGNGSIGPIVSFDPTTVTAPEPAPVERVVEEPAEPTGVYEVEQDSDVPVSDEPTEPAPEEEPPASEEFVEPAPEDVAVESAPKTSKKKSS